MTQYMTVRQLAENFPAFSENSIRYMVFHAEKTGLDKAIRRVGRKVLLNPDLFCEWIEDQSQNGGA